MTSERYPGASRPSRMALLVLAVVTLSAAVTGAANDVRAKDTSVTAGDERRPSGERVVAVSSPTPVRVKHVHLKPAAEVETPATILEFDMLNDSVDPVTDVVVEISIAEKSASHQPPRVVAGPFTIKGEAVLEPGYTIKYQMIMRNLSSDCDCVANVGVVSARPVAAADR
jgi:hypothetical protein